MTTRLSTRLAALTLAATLATLPSLTLAQSAKPADAATPATAAAPADTQAAPVPPPKPAAVSKETVDNPYGLAALWAQGDFVSRGTLIILVVMSMGSWYILVTKLWESFKLGGEARAVRKGLLPGREPGRRCEAAEEEQCVPLHRRNRHRRQRAP